ncbi:porin [Pelagibacterium sediminicola]|uniref:porin n=1 Tax=Pelagibacterium sediminicola TaxID=2248761 RepID=UPI000E313765|nr:porin [Pelagibacterium sediminicola]
MKLKSLFLGSAAALALTSGALAADPRSSFVSLDVCDAYGITGLTIASSDTCLKISGEVSYNFQWGDYTGGPAYTWAGGTAARTIDNSDGAADWRSRALAILKFEATTQTDAGAAKAVISLRHREGYINGTREAAGDWSLANDLHVNEAYVSFGDTTVLMAGKKGTIAKLGNDEPFNYLGLANSSQVEDGVLTNAFPARGGHVIQVVSEVADGVSVGAALEKLDTPTGSFVGFVEANGGWGNAHATVVAGNILGAGATTWGLHTGATFNFDNFKVRGALALDDTGDWNALLSGEAAFDMFTLAASAEFLNTAGVNELGLGASVGFQATETVKINAGFRYFDPNTAAANDEGWQAALQVVAAVAEGIEASAAVGAYGGGTIPAANDPVAYVDLGLTYKPGGGFETGVGLEANALGAYKVKFNAKKSF